MVSFSDFWTYIFLGFREIFVLFADDFGHFAYFKARILFLDFRSDLRGKTHISVQGLLRKIFSGKVGGRSSGKRGTQG